LKTGKGIKWARYSSAEKAVNLTGTPPKMKKRALPHEAPLSRVTDSARPFGFGSGLQDKARDSFEVGTKKQKPDNGQVAGNTF